MDTDAIVKQIRGMVVEHKELIAKANRLERQVYELYSTIEHTGAMTNGIFEEGLE